MESNEMRQRLDEALSSYENQLANYEESRKKFAAVTGAATSPRREVTATVGRGGELTELSFPTGAWKRMTPAELCSLIVRTVADARQQAMDATAELLGPMLPPSISAKQLLDGDLDLPKLMRSWSGEAEKEGA